MSRRRICRVLEIVGFILVLLVIIISAFFIFKGCMQDEGVTEDENITEESFVECVTNDDCDIQTEECKNNVCVEWNPLEGY